MNLAQRIALAVGLLIIVVTGLFPPWVGHRIHTELRDSTPLGHASIFSPPKVGADDNRGRYYPAVDVTRLVILEGVAIVATGGMMVLLKSRRGSAAPAAERKG